MLKVIDSVKEARAYIGKVRGEGKTIGLIPTMGALHEGHFSLIRRSVSDNDMSIVTVFVNPAQFGPGEDFERYPRDLEKDCVFANAAGADMVFAPLKEEMYPEAYNTYVEVRGLTDVLCGKSRPGHFRGVTTVCTKLFNVISADKAYFGQKDAQQLLIIKKLVKDLNIPITVIACPIIREEDGLAMSSRNKYLNEEQRANAVCLYKAISEAENLYKRGENRTAVIRDKMAQIIGSTKDAKIDYIELLDQETLKEVETIEKPVLAAVAVYFGDTRLIDNTVLG